MELKKGQILYIDNDKYSVVNMVEYIERGEETWIWKEYEISKEAIYGEVNKLAYNKTSDRKVLEKAPIKNFIKKENSEKIDEAIIKREKMVIYILLNYPEESYSALKDIITADDMKSKMNKEILTKIYEQYSKKNMGNILDLFTEEDSINYLSGIMADDFGVTDVAKCIEDLISTYNREKLTNRRNDILKQLESANLSAEDSRMLERELNEIILKLAKVKNSVKSLWKMGTNN